MAKGTESSKEGWRLAAGDVPLDAWRELYRLAGKMRRLAPWDWMWETEVFGVRDTGSDEVVFGSVMGQMGDYHAMALYPGEKELSAFLRLEQDPREDAAESLFDICQIHVAFGRKGELMPRRRR